GHAVELLLERLHLPCQSVLALVETLHALRVRFLAVAQSAYLVGDPLLVAGDPLGGAHRALDVLLGTGLAALLRPPPRAPSPPRPPRGRGAWSRPPASGDSPFPAFQASSGRGRDARGGGPVRPPPRPVAGGAPGPLRPAPPGGRG